MIPAWSPREPSQCPWSRNTLRKVGKALTSDEPWPEGLPTFEDVSLWYQEIVGFVQATLYHLDLSSVIGDIEVTINGRTKTHGTLKEKLIREKSVPLHNIQDVAGVRFEADMTLSQQSGVVAWTAVYLRSIGWKVGIKDYRTAPGLANYRAVHMRLERESDKARAEIQVRTRLQGLWANVYEKLADGLGREIRYGFLPDDPEWQEVVKSFQKMSIDEVRVAEENEQISESVVNDMKVLERQANDNPVILNSSSWVGPTWKISSGGSISFQDMRNKLMVFNQESRNRRRSLIRTQEEILHMLDGATLKTNKEKE